MQADRTARLDRLVGNGRDNQGGGMPLPWLFSLILNRLQDEGPADLNELAEIGEREIGKRARLRTTYGDSPDDVWEAHVADVLSQMAELGVVTFDGAAAQLGPRFVTGEALKIIPARKGRNAAIGVTVWPAQERA